MSLRTPKTLADEAGVTTSGEGAVLDFASEWDIVFELQATKNSGSATLDAKLQDSFDGGVTWHDWVIFDQLAATGAQAKGPDRPCGGDVKPVWTVTGTGNWDVRIKSSSNLI